MSIGTVIAFGLSTPLVRGTVEANMPQWEDDAYLQPSGTEAEFSCVGPLFEVDVYHTDRTAWLLAANPFVVLADALPYSDDGMSGGPLQGIGQAVRYAQAGAESSGPQCINGEPRAFDAPASSFPIWPLGLTVQFAGAALALVLAWRRLRTPAQRLAAGTRIA